MFKRIKKAKPNYYFLSKKGSLKEAAKNLYTTLRKIKKSTHDNRVKRAANMVELTDFLHRKPAELSGGQKQRVALARAIVREPNVFLMIRRPPRSTQSRSSAASDVYKRQTFFR